MTMKPLVIYHADCTDGFGAAFAAWLKLGDDAEYLPMSYGGQEDKWFGGTFCSDEVVSTLDHREVYILDFSLPREHMDYIFANAKRVIWLDHHKTAFEMWCGKYERGATHKEIGAQRQYVGDGACDVIVLDDNKSGAMLAWEYFHPDTTIPMLIKHIDDRDRWQFKLEGSKELHAALQSYKPWSFEQWTSFVPYKSRAASYIAEAISEGNAILRAQDQNVASMAKQARKCSIDTGDVEIAGHYYANGLAVNANIHQSELGHVLATQSGTYGLIWYVDAGGAVNCSLRSNGDYDVSAIAKAFGGGGHKNAAGFQTDINTLMGWLI